MCVKTYADEWLGPAQHILSQRGQSVARDSVTGVHVCTLPHEGLNPPTTTIAIVVIPRPALTVPFLGGGSPAA